MVTWLCADVYNRMRGQRVELDMLAMYFPQDILILLRYVAVATMSELSGLIIQNLNDTQEAREYSMDQVPLQE